MKNFVELRKRTYYRGGYISTSLLVALGDISRVIECEDDRDLSNLVTKDGKVHNLNERYMDVVRKIKNATEESEEV